MTYKLINDLLTGKPINYVLRKEDKAQKIEQQQIPFDTANKDYQKYLEWVEEGNTADPAD